jgi:hypothetical protein
MLYTGLTQAEITKLEALLNESATPFNVHVDGEKLDTKQPRTGANVFALEINDDDLKKIPTKYHAQLERYGIHTNIDIPDDFFTEAEAPKKVEEVKPKITGWRRYVNWQGAVLLIMAYMYISKRMGW